MQEVNEFIALLRSRPFVETILKLPLTLETDHGPVHVETFSTLATLFATALSLNQHYSLAQSEAIVTNIALAKFSKLPQELLVTADDLTYAAQVLYQVPLLQPSVEVNPATTITDAWTMLFRATPWVNTTYQGWSIVKTLAQGIATFQARLYQAGINEATIRIPQLEPDIQLSEDVKESFKETVAVATSTLSIDLIPFADLKLLYFVLQSPTRLITFTGTVKPVPLDYFFNIRHPAMLVKKVLDEILALTDDQVIDLDIVAHKLARYFALMYRLWRSANLLAARPFAEAHERLYDSAKVLAFNDLCKRLLKPSP